MKFKFENTFVHGSIWTYPEIIKIAWIFYDYLIYVSKNFNWSVVGSGSGVLPSRFEDAERSLMFLCKTLQPWFQHLLKNDYYSKEII